MDCSVVIVSYNTYDLTREAVRTALAGASGLDLEVVVVDNASPDGTAARLEDAFAGEPVTVIANDDNRGFSAANNQGAAVAAGRVLFFLNPDTVVHDDAVGRLVEFLDGRPDVGAAGPRVLNADGTDQASTATFESVGSILRNCFPIVPRRRPPLGRPSRVDVVNGCALALRRQAFDAVGGWDERYFMYAEENELCLALEGAGYANAFVPDAVITHYGGAASADRYVEQQVLATQSADAFLRRHASPALVAFNRVAALVGYGARVPAFAALARLRPSQAADYRRRGAAAAAICRALVHGSRSSPAS